MLNLLDLCGALHGEYHTGRPTAGILVRVDKGNDMFVRTTRITLSEHNQQWPRVVPSWSADGACCVEAMGDSQQCVK